GHDVGGITRRPALAAGDRADIAGALPLALHDLAEPTFGLHVGKRQRKNHGRRDAALRRDASMRGAAENLDRPSVGADRADRDVRRRAAVVVEGHQRRAEFFGPDVTRAIEPALLAHAEQERDRRMIELLLLKFGRKRHQYAAAAAVVAAERGL